MPTATQRQGKQNCQAPPAHTTPDTCSSEDARIAAGGWPFQLLADQLLAELFHVSWEVRHGAAVGLRQISTHHAACAAVQMPVAEPLSGWHRPGGSGHMDLGPVDIECVRAAHEEQRRWLQGAVNLMLSVLVLDRFADYTGDQVAAPVRETVAQALALTVAPLPPEEHLHLLKLFSSMQQVQVWEVRHGAMLAIKYLLATHHAAAISLLPAAMPALKHALHEGDDDVRAAAAHALVPLVAAVADMGRDTVEELTTCLWAMLPQLGDISAATQSVLQLIGSLYSLEGGSTLPQDTADPVSDATAKLPLLWPFLQHTLPDVQVESCRCIRSLCTIMFGAEAPCGSNASICPQTLRTLLHLTFEALLTTPQSKVVAAAEALFLYVAQASPPAALANALDAQTIQSLTALPCLPAAEPLPREYLCVLSPWIGTDSGSNGSAERLQPCTARIAGGEAAGVLARQILCAQLLAACLTCCSTQRAEEACLVASSNMQNLLGTYLQHPSATAQAFAAMVYFFWLLPQPKPAETTPVAVHDQLHEALASAYHVALQELATPHHNMLSALGTLFRALNDAQTPAALPEGFCIDSVDATYAATILEAVAPAVPDEPSHPIAIAHAAASTAVQRLTSEASLLRCKLSAVLAAAAAAWRELPAKVTLLVQPLMAAVRRLPDEPLHEQVIAPALAELMLACASRVPCPNGKILKHLIALACTLAQTDTDSRPATPKAGSPAPSSLLASASSGLSHSVLADVAEVAQTHDAPDAAARASAQAALRCLARRAGGELPERVPQLWGMITGPVATYAGGTGPAGQDETAQMLTAVRVLSCTVRDLHADVHARLTPVLSSLVACAVRAAGTAAATVVSECLAALADAQPGAHLEPLVATASTLQDTQRPPANRRAGAALACALLDPSHHHLTAALLPFALLLTTPALAGMSDPLPDVRAPAAAAFGRLVALLPLVPRGELPPTPSLPPELRAKRAADAAFLEQLSEASRVAPFEPPVAPAGVDLRGYQRDGIAWLAFLRRFGLHGILADDMGLGKTLQTLTIVAAAMHEARTAGAPPAPSLVVCPASLVGHWVAEAERYFGHAGMRPVAIQGSAAKRAAAQARVAQGGHGLLAIASYDTVRASASWLAQWTFEYAVLDEGHTIRNPKAKVSQACKQVVARHRLLLTGTPIQNSARELWALFDFLMPGLLGTESAFNARFRAAAAPSAGSGAAKKPAATQQAALSAALEELHQQVLPFLLRRTKEQVLQDLPPKIMQDIYCDLSPLQQALYDGAVSSQKAGEWAAAAGRAGASAGNSDAFEMLSFLRKLCSHPRLAVSWERADHVAAVRAALPVEHTGSASAALAALAHVSHSPKLLALQQLLADCGVLRGDGDADALPPESARRLLVFAQLRGTLDLVESAVLVPSGVAYLRLDGDVKPSERHEVVQRFNADPTIDVMLLTTAVGGLGLNLTAADTVVFLEHDWNPMKDLQAMDRAHRLGQKKVVTVYRLLMRGTLEERIMSLQHFKADVAAAVVNTDNVATASMETGGVLDIVGASAGTSAGQAGASGAASRQDDGNDEMAGQYDDISMETFLKRMKKAL